VDRVRRLVWGWRRVGFEDGRRATRRALVSGLWPVPCSNGLGGSSAGASARGRVGPHRTPALRFGFVECPRAVAKREKIRERAASAWDSAPMQGKARPAGDTQASAQTAAWPACCWNVGGLACSGLFLAR